ncbi:DinB family protein [Enterobacter roggenkampii]|uniref:DinB family protein n=1 Tax=Enterobacter roggenkampii TaxID=1812935 RepID=UPI002A804082|nr:DinB family protein [Enterobacter roggenkampii]
MITTIPFFYTMIKLKQFQEIAFYDVLLSPECEPHQDIIQAGAYWLNHINIVDNIFRAHLWGEQHHYDSTESDDVPDLTCLRNRAIASNKWLLAYSSTLTLHTSAQRVSFTFTDGTDGDMTRAEILLHLLTHSQGHLSFIASLLAEKGLSIPPILLTTMSSMPES